MKLKLRFFRLSAGKPIAFVHELDAEKIGLHTGDRIEVKSNGSKTIAIIDIVKDFIKKGEIALSQEIIKTLNINKTSSAHVEIDFADFPESARIIQKKIDSKQYSKLELKEIMQDIVNNSLTEAEIAYFVSGVQHCGMSLNETKWLAEAILETGKKISWGNKKIADKHSIGGIPGNRTTPIIVSICAAAGVTMPKTSSRAITSAAGTADVIESIAKVDLSIPELKKVVKKTGACMVWGGSLGLAPADDKLIRIEKLLNLDPEPQLIASILAKKLAVGSKYILIDIPCGKGAKVSRHEAIKLKNKFVKIGGELGLTLKIVLTDGTEPIGNGIGPTLEIKDVLKVLERKNPPNDLENKSLKLAGLILEMLGKCDKGRGFIKAKQILNSGAAFKKFKEIISAQKGNLKNLGKAKFSRDIKSEKSGVIKEIENKSINYLARLAGCPLDKNSGIYLYKHKGDKIKKGETILTIYSESKHKLREALKFYKTSKPIKQA